MGGLLFFCHTLNAVRVTAGPCACMLQAPAKPESLLREALLLAIPTAFDLAATVLMNVGLLSVTASVYQMVRAWGTPDCQILLP